MTFQDLILSLNRFWEAQGCVLVPPYDIEMGAGTFHPATFFKAFGKDPWRTAYVQPCRRPTDGRYGDNPLRTQHYYQYQVILKPAPADVQDLYLKSLKALGILLNRHDIRFVEDDWESPTLGASGLGWEVWLDSLEVTQFTYFQQMAGVELDVISCELTYGLERICMFLQNCFDLFQLAWTDRLSYGDLHRKDEQDFCRYNFEESDPKVQRDLFEVYEKQAKALSEKGSYQAAYEFVLKMSHAFNLMDARGAVGQTERPALIARIRNLAKVCAQLYLEQKDGAKK